MSRDQNVDKVDEIRVVHFQRKRPDGRFSIEGYFDGMRSEMESIEGITVQKVVMPFASEGVLRRIGNMMFAAMRQGDINHITGDIHYVAAFLRRRRTLLTIHDLEILDRSAGWRRTLLRWLWFAMPVRRSGWVSVVSQATRRALCDELGITEDRIAVVHTAISGRFKPRPQRFDTDCPRILQIGTKANKNLPRLAAALSGLPCHVVVVGRMTSAQRTAFESAAVSFEEKIGLSDEAMLAEYHRSDLVSLVSTKEGFGMPIVEGNAVGRVVITSDCSSMPEIANDAAEQANPSDVDAIRKKFENLFADAERRRWLVEAGFENAKRFLPGKIARSYVELYRRMHSARSG